MTRIELRKSNDGLPCSNPSRVAIADAYSIRLLFRHAVGVMAVLAIE